MRIRRRDGWVRGREEISLNVYLLIQNAESPISNSITHATYTATHTHTRYSSKRKQNLVLDSTED